MKRKLESELISIAHRILKIKNKSELAQLQQETLKLYEKISVLRFVEENFSEVKPTIGYANAEKEVEAIYEAEENAEVDTLAENAQEEVQKEETKAEEEVITEPTIDVVDVPLEASADEEVLETVEEDESQTAATVEEEEPVVFQEEIVEHAAEVVEEDVEEESEVDESEDVVEEAIVDEPEIEFAPLFEISQEEVAEIVLPKQITLEDFLTEGHVEPIFVRAEQSYSNETTTTQVDADEKETVTKVEVVETKKTQFVIDHHEPKSVSLNDSLSKTINIGLNDRIGFEKHLFGGSNEDMNRVLSQLSTYANFGEAQEFIEDMVKPDYNNWTGKEEYAARFMEIIEKKFS